MRHAEAERHWFAIRRVPINPSLPTLAVRLQMAGPDAYLQRNYANHSEAKVDITAYIVWFYNCQRLYSLLGNLPPSVYERTLAAKEPIVVSEIT